MPWHLNVKKFKRKLYDAVPGASAVGSAVGASIHGAANVATAVAAAMLGAQYMSRM